jgi:hypothetical protein
MTEISTEFLLNTKFPGCLFSMKLITVLYLRVNFKLAIYVCKMKHFVLFKDKDFMWTPEYVMEKFQKCAFCFFVIAVVWIHWSNWPVVKGKRYIEYLRNTWRFSHAPTKSLQCVPRACVLGGDSLNEIRSFQHYVQSQGKVHPRTTHKGPEVEY